jgi:hypothetical protein
MIWDEARWDGKIKEKWGKAYPDEEVAGRVQEHLDRLEYLSEELAKSERLIAAGSRARNAR